MKCILKAKEGYGAKILYFKENEFGEKTLYLDKNFKQVISHYDKESIIIISDKIDLIEIKGDLFLPIKEFNKIRKEFFS